MLNNDLIQPTRILKHELKNCWNEKAQQPTTIHVGDTIDFWRVLYANKEEGRLLLFAEMKLPGEAWLEFKMVDKKLVQTATFRPLGLAGRLYWYLVLPFHGFIFKGMLGELTSRKQLKILQLRLFISLIFLHFSDPYKLWLS